jgi:hypothetical protein
MRPRILLFALCCPVLLTSIVPAHLCAQSLADVARQEEERRKAIKQPSKVITNQDLGAAPAVHLPPPESQAGAAAKAKTAAAVEADKAEAAKEPKESGPAKDQAYWSGRMKELQAQLARDQVYADALQSRLNALTADFVNRDDPVQKTAIANDKQKALDESNRLKLQILDDKKAIADLQEEARRASVPPGWLR